MPRYAKKRDANEPEIVEQLRQLGFIVILLDEPCDLLVQCYCGAWQPIEVKNPDSHYRAKGKEARTKKQLKILASLHQPIPIARSTLEALRILTQHSACFPGQSNISS